MKIIKKEDLKKLQQSELEILKEFDRLCQENNLKYSLAFGTLLGAVRHKGFIPWDDDVDVMMPIEDYLKFEQLAKQQLNEKFFFQNKFTDKNFYLYWNKIRMNNTTSVVRGYEDIDLNWGICIDIFPVFKMPASEKKVQKQIRYLKLSIACLESILYKYEKKNGASKNSKILYKILTFLPRSCVNKISEYFYRKVYKYNGNYDNMIDYSEIFKRRIIMDKTIFDDLDSIEFEGCKFKVVREYKKLLEQLYGDYIKLPPKGERVAHGDLILKFNDDEGKYEQ